MAWEPSEGQIYAAPVNYSARTRIESLSLSGSGSFIRITIGYAGTDYTIDECYFGLGAGGVNNQTEPDFAGTPTQVSFDGGSPSASITADKISDPIAFSYDGSNDYIISVYMGNGFGALGNPATTPNTSTHYKVSVNEASQVDVTGYTEFASRMGPAKKLETAL